MKGKARTKLLDHSAGLVEGFSSGPSWDFIYQTSTVKHPDFNIGDRVALPDGRVFRYSKVGSLTVLTNYGAAYEKKVNAYAVAPAQGTDAGAVGDWKVSMTVASPFGLLGTGVLAENELRGGYVVIGHNTDNPQTRGIVGHPALAAAGILTVDLDASLVTAVTVGTTGIEAMGNPYGQLINTGGAGEYMAFLGVPAVGATTGQHFWLQTWGPVWIVSDGNTCDGLGDRTIYFMSNGSVKSGNDVTIESGFQMAGFAMDRSGLAASNSPLVMLQISP